VSSYFSRGGASDINTLKSSKLQIIQCVPHREYLVFGFSTTVCSAVHVIGCLLLDREQSSQNTQFSVLYLTVRVVTSGL